jgi:hypothetical protein
VGLTRARVSQVLKDAEAAGLALERVKGCGYRLLEAPDFLDGKAVAARLQTLRAGDDAAPRRCKGGEPSASARSARAASRSVAPASSTAGACGRIRSRGRLAGSKGRIACRTPSAACIETGQRPAVPRLRPPKLSPRA